MEVGEAMSKGRHSADEAFRKAKKAQDEYVATLPKGSPETDRYLELNRKTSEAIAKLPWYRR
jgi:hypothetical protein